MDNLNDKDYTNEYLSLKAANDRFREQGKQWLWQTLDIICSEISRELIEQPGGTPLQIGRQEWQFKVEDATMVGERFGARYAGRTLIVEAGWPRLPEHGFVTDGGLARARIGLSRNTILEAQTLAELILKKQVADRSEAVWHVFSNKKAGALLSVGLLRRYVKQILDS